MSNSLSGVRVLDLSRFIAGPYCGMLLGDFGADVLKVERATTGDDSRLVYPQVEGESLYYLVFNRNKRSLSLDLRNPEAQQVLQRLIGEADVVIENFRPGTMEKMGCGYEQMRQRNPRLIMARISGFGQTGPLAENACFDSIAQAMSGLMELTGAPDGPPMSAGTFMVDYASGLYTTIGILLALRHREQTGTGQLVDTSLLDSALSLLLTAIPAQAMLGLPTSRLGNQDRYVAPGHVYKTRDQRWIKVVGGGDGIFPRLAEAIARPDLKTDERYSTLACRLANRAEIDAILSSWIEERDYAEVLGTFDRSGVPAALVATPADVLENPQVRHRQGIVSIPHPTAGDIVMQGVTIKLSESPGELTRHPPLLGEHNDEVLEEWLGLSREEIARMTAARLF